MRENHFNVANMSKAGVLLYDAPDDSEQSDSGDGFFMAKMTMNVGSNPPNDSTKATVYMDRVRGSGNFKYAFVCRWVLF